MTTETMTKEPSLKTAGTYLHIQADLVEEETVLRLTLNQPPGNVLTMTMVRELDDVLEQHKDRASLRLVVLRGAGRHFCYGASVEEHRRDEAPEMLKTFHGFVRRLVSYPVPTAALVDGRCLGGGFELVLCCHFLFATSRASFACPEIKLGVFPPVLACLGPHRLGGMVAERLLLTGESLNASNAERLGLLTAVFDGEGDADEALLEWYRSTLKPLSAFALRQSTRVTRQSSGLVDVLGRGLEAAERQYVEEVITSYDGNEGVEAFLAKRPPVWRD